jgi:putative lipopolysaccharide biosynthesis O-acetyl transferase wbbJ
MINKISNRYTFWDKINLVYLFVLTKIKYPGQRIIRRPFTIRGGKMIDWGKKLTTGVGCRIEAFIADEDSNSKIHFGDRIQLNDYVHISSVKSVTIGDDVLIASHVYISDNSHGSYRGDKNDTSPLIIPTKRPYYTAPVKIGNRVWIGEGVIIMPGVTIGNGSIIGAHSIVNKDIPGNTIAVGSPAKAIKHWNEITQKWEKASTNKT